MKKDFVFVPIKVGKSDCILHAGKTWVPLKGGGYKVSTCSNFIPVDQDFQRELFRKGQRSREIFKFRMVSIFDVIAILRANKTRTSLITQIVNDLWGFERKVGRPTRIEVARNKVYTVVTIEGHVGVAKCNSSDRFQLVVGFSIALVRAYKEWIK